MESKYSNVRLRILNHNITELHALLIKCIPNYNKPSASVKQSLMCIDTHPYNNNRIQKGML